MRHKSPAIGWAKRASWRTKSFKNISKSEGKKSKFFQMPLVSNEIRSLFSGGAKFNPMEMGLTMCWVPLTPLINSNSATRAERSGRYGLMDQAADFLANARLGDC